MKFSDGEITVNGSKINRAFTYRRLTNLFESNNKYEQGQHPIIISQTPKTAPTRKEPEAPGLVETVIDAIGSSTTDLFRPGPVPNQEPPLTDDELERRKRKRKRKGRRL